MANLTRLFLKMALPTAAVQGEVMWVTSAPVNWAVLEPPPEELELMLSD